MARLNYEFTSESVSEGHPDKVCDRISDEIVDLFFREGAIAGLDPYQIRVACETLATTNRRGHSGGSPRTEPFERANRGDGAPGDQGHRLRARGVSLARREDRDPAARAVRRHRTGRGRHRQQGRGRRRSGHHVRLCLPRDARADAGAPVLRPQNPARDIAGASFGRGENARSRRQEPSHGALPEWQARRGDPDRRVAPASRSSN